MKKFLRLSRSPFLTAVITPFLLGTALAFQKRGTLDPLILLLTALALIFTHLGSNLLNDYFDFRQGADINNNNRTPFSGGSSDIVEGKEAAETFLVLGALSLGVAAVLGLFLVWLVDLGPGPLLYLGIAGIFIGYAYTAPPFKLAYRGLGEIMIFLAFGPLPVLGTYYALTRDFSLWPVIASLPLSFLITNIIWINEIPDLEADRAAGKRTLVVRMGAGPACYVYDTIAALAFVSIVLLVVSGKLTPWALAALAGMIPAIAASIKLHGTYNNPKAMVPAQAMTILAHLITGALLSVGIFVDTVF